MIFQFRYVFVRAQKKAQYRLTFNKSTICVEMDGFRQSELDNSYKYSCKLDG